MILMQQLISRKLGDNIVTVTNNVLHTFLKIFAVVPVCLASQLLPIQVNLSKTFAIRRGHFYTSSASERQPFRIH